jgi:alpha-D-xyloside xylohydrolase
MPETHEIPRFLSQTVPVEFVSELVSYAIEGQSVILHCATKHYHPELYNYYGTICETVHDEPESGQPVTIQLDFLTPEIFRVRYSPGPTIPAHDTPMVVGRFDNPVQLDIRESETVVTLATSSLRVEIVREPWQLKVFGVDNRLVFSTSPVDIAALRRPEEQWNPPQQRWIFLHRYAYPLGATNHSEQQHVFASFDLRYDEHIYGFGESYGPLDKRGTRQELWLQEGFGNASPASYKQVPFYMSSRGYGLFVNTSNALRFNVGNLEHTTLSVIVDDTSLLDFYFIYGPTIKEILPRYTAITGQPHVPPKWSFGLWMARISYNRQEQVEAVAQELRSHKIPCDVVHIDTDWFEHDWACDLRFGPEKFPDPAAMTARLRDQGFKVSVWQWPNLIVNTSMFTEGVEAGYLAKRRNGHPYIFPGFMADAGFIDYSNPQAVAWVQEKIQRLFELGIAVIKVDFGEGAPPDAVYHGVASEAMHNLYPLLYNRAMFEVAERFWGKSEAMVWARSAWAGSQRYPVHWSGDGVARSEDLACVLRSSLSFGLSGFPFYSHDIGGFSGLPSPELYVRWAQFGLFSSHARAHGAPPREPWAFGESAEALFRRYDELRYRLMPYIFSEAVECGHSSLPMVRALVIDYQDDPTTHTVEDVYLLGRNLLVAPVLDASDIRRLYLPPGEWVDYWTKEAYSGGRWITVSAPLEIMPLFVRAGAILPLGPVMQYVDEKPCDPLTVEIYHPGVEGHYVVHNQQQPDISISYQLKGTLLTVWLENAPGQVQLDLYGVELYEVTVGNAPAEIERLNNGGVRVVMSQTGKIHLTVVKG